MLRPYLTTGIGSLPHTDAREAVNLVIEAFDIPFWPQLPRLSFREQMIAQYAEGLPFIRINEEKQTLRVERAADGEELERFYESYTEDTRLAISEGHAEGLHMFLEMTSGRRFDYIKGHVTGPLTFSLGLSDSGGLPAYYDEELREVYLMGLKGKVRWQVDALRTRGEQVLIFIDEPVASALGSSTYLAVERAEALRLLSEMVQAVKDSGAIPGIHCCGRAEWPLFLESGVGILNFDAYDYGETLAIYPSEIRAFLEKGGVLAWGIVPTTEKINSETGESIYRRFMERLDGLSRFVPETLLRNGIMLTPSCGAGSLTKEETLRVFGLLGELKGRIS